MSDPTAHSQQTDSSAPIGLEMSRKTKISCTVILLVVIFLVGFAFVGLKNRGREQANRTIILVYTAAQAATHDMSYVEHMLSESAKLTLQKAAQVNGPVQSWHILKTDTGLTGRPSTVYVETKRNNKDYVDVVVTTDNSHIAVVVEFPKEDWESGREDHAIRVIAK